MRALTKRLFDVAVASVGLVASAPLLGLAALAIKADSAGPVLYSQIRVGRGKQPFRVLKLRTMRSDADARGSLVTAARDPRITRTGALLRATKLDELPQLWNVLRGDMSLVGPRPEVPAYVAKYRSEWERVFAVRPGLTDPASITFRHEETLLAAARDRERAYVEVLLPLKLQLAIDGLQRDSLVHDLATIMRTVFSLARNRDEQRDIIIAEAHRRIAALNNEGTP